MILIRLFLKRRLNCYLARFGVFLRKFYLGILNSALGILEFLNSRSCFKFAVAVKIRLQGCEVNLASFYARLAVSVKIKGAAR